MTKNVLFLLKKLGIKVLHGLLDTLIHLKNIIVFILTWTVAKPLWWLGKTVLFSFVLLAYKWGLFIKIHWWDKIYAPIKIKIIYPLTRRYVTHSIIAIITIFSVATSLSAKAASLENSEQIGQKSILYALSSNNENPESIGFVQETADLSGAKTTNYLGSDVGITPPTATFGSDSDLANDLPIASVGGDSTLLNPNLPSVINSNSRTKVVEYLVEGGDTVGSIAEKFSINVNTVLWANNLTGNSTIRPGDKLVILPTSGVLHQVKRGDTVEKIASYYSANAEKVLEFNALPDSSDIKIGEYLIVPDGKVPPPAPAPRPAVATRNVVNIPSSSIIPTSGDMLWPNGCSRITQYFSWKHSGVDIACPIGTPIHAAEDGVVYRVQYLSTGYGHNVMINHGGGVMTLYGHMTTILVKVGDTIEKGEEIGLEGSTGHSTGPHLHFEVRIGGKVVNPLNYIR